MNRDRFIISLILIASLFVLAACTNSTAKEAGNKNDTAVKTETTTASNETKAAGLEEFNKFISGLDTKDISSISKAVDKYKSLAGEDKKENDKMFNSFYEFLGKVIEDINNNGVNNLDKAVLKQNGLRVNYSESGAFVGERPSFLCDNFSKYVSDAKREFLNIELQESREIGDEDSSTYLLEDSALMISWDQLSERIIRWEKYLQDYPDSEDKEEALHAINFYMWVYTASPLDNTPVFKGDTLSDEVKASYENFISKHQESIYAACIKDYYEVLKQHNFKLDNNVIEYLKKNNIDTEYLEQRIAQ